MFTGSRIHGYTDVFTCHRMSSDFTCHHINTSSPIHRCLGQQKIRVFSNLGSWTHGSRLSTFVFSSLGITHRSTRKNKKVHCGVSVCQPGQCSHIHTHITYCCFAKKGKFPVENWLPTEPSSLVFRILTGIHGYTELNNLRNKI